MAPKKNEWLNKVKAARTAGVPILAIASGDPQQTIIQVCRALKLNNGGDTPAIQWDLIRGLLGVNEAGRVDVVKMVGNDDPTIGNFVEAMKLLVNNFARGGDGGVAFIHLSHRFIQESAYIQAIWNLRDEFKSSHRILVLLGTQFILPPELVNDIVLIDEPLPAHDDLSAIVNQTYKNVADQVSITPDAEHISAAANALHGTTAFAAEQLAAMSMSRSGINVDELWEAKCKQVEQTPGLKVFRGGGTFADIGGYDVVKSFLSDIQQGDDKPQAIVYIDEIEKSITPAGDTSGVNQDQLGQFLQNMQDSNADGVILLGHPGGGKSELAKATGNVAGIPTIQLDFGAVKGSLVGQSEQQLRQAFKVIDSVSNRRALYIATCNSIGSLPPELRRRFKLGVFFVDLPDADARDKIWRIYEKRWGVKRAGFKGDNDWTGAEIRNCCHIARRLNRTIEDAANFIVPICRSAPESIEALRTLAHGRFLDASKPGTYRMPGRGDDKAISTPATGGRRITIDD